MIGYKLGLLLERRSKEDLHNSVHNVKNWKNNDEKYTEENTSTGEDLSKSKLNAKKKRKK